MILRFSLFLLPLLLNAQSYTMKGQFWASSLSGDDVPKGQSAFESTIGYIPNFSISKELNQLSLLDLEFAYRFDKSYSGDLLTQKHENPHRAWIRYSSEKIEARLGLQKIVFGPSQVLRSLSWFDTFNLADPTGQTDGVNAFRLRWFPNNLLSVWSWAIQEKDEMSFGGRTELSNALGEWGLTFHLDSESHNRFLGQTPVIVSDQNKRIGLDYRFDGFIGFWNESAIVYLDDRELGFITVGADYTLPVASGILIMTETLYMSNSYTQEEQTLSAFMASVPLGMIHQIMFISQVDWENDHWHHYIRWGSTFDKFSLNFILSRSPNRSGYSVPSEYLPQTVAGFGTNFQIMFIYNH